MCAMFGESFPPNILLHFYLSSFPICQCRLDMLRYLHLLEAMEFHTFFSLLFVGGKLEIKK